MQIEERDFNIFKQRREQLISKLKENEAVLLASHPVYYRQNDVPYLYRQDSFFYYMTGFEEPESYLILKKREPSSVLFVRNKDPKKEMWDGRILGPVKARELLLMNEAYGIHQFEEKLPDLLKDISYLYQARTINKMLDQQVDRVLVSEKTKDPESSKQYHFLDVKDRIAEMRMIKTDWEVEKIKKACDITRSAHIAVMKAVGPGINERHLHGVFIQKIMELYSQRESYTGIFAGGENALILHYIDNNQVCRDGDLVLVDAGAEWEYYASDITRTFPVNGRFTPPQKTLYNHVLSIQKQIIEMIRPGLSFRRIQNQTRQLMLECFKKEKLLDPKSNIEDVIQFFPHNFGHLLGLDVHDVGVLKNGEKAYRLEPGMVITVEPGIYVPKNKEGIPSEFKGIGIRIEDNILVTKNGFENLSQSIPKEVDEIEEIMSS